ncbi:16S rRNA (cytosine(1402)-N(4))-methyltransferase RsmH [Marinigracilibium pacificum]|uniref:Ribosomal RNA small subunit methyltransferase H n=1 Tax=Marinigracilibium pacificum TaxID=2729599 RepID=A0A848J2T1_9BACT|nr:16S rRNA (cytosine(1402)-N(4))-methyltransferase RsmH [Marinigracilibium pacificum]NMM50076.1 16S rRNA (cytosine(1402)-N(4))-methyltransferase RsmH [Marinigracilibium pacificum]
MMYHKPVMLGECIEGLAIKPEGVYVDVTFGGGGHSKPILKLLSEGKLFAFDQDVDAKANADQIESPNFQFIQSNFRYLKKYLKLYGINKVDGVLADLGISSHQIDVPERGFSTRYEAQLDMRMDQNSNLTAEEIVNTYSESQLHRIFGIYGELKNARTAAATIVSHRINNRIQTVNQLKEVLKSCTPRGKENKYHAQVFQALRIEVNDEMKALEDFLMQTAEVIKPGGRLVVMSYHSLEDRMVKNFIAKGNFQGQPEKDFYGNLIRPFEPVNRKPIIASDEEVAENSRARSAKLRIGERLEDE